MERSMLKARKMPNHFEGEATSIDVYIISRRPTNKLHKKSHYETWSGMKSSVGHFKIFGSLCYRHLS